MQTADWLSARPQRLSLTQGQVTLRNILLPTDFSESSTRALDYALGIASRYESKLHLFHCINPSPYSLVDPDVVWKTRDDVREEIEELVSNLRRQGRARDVDINTLVEVEGLAALLPRVVRDLHIDMTVVGTHGRTGWRKVVLGSVAEIVIDEVSCPVLSVGPSAEQTRIQRFGPENILLVSEACARSQLPESYAFSLARKYGSRLIAVDVLENRCGRVLAQVSELKWSETELSHTILDSALTCGSQLSPEVGSQSDLVLEVARRMAADLIVLEVPASHKFADRFISTDSYRVVCGARCPVLTVHAR